MYCARRKTRVGQPQHKRRVNGVVVRNVLTYRYNTCVWCNAEQMPEQQPGVEIVAMPIGGECNYRRRAGHGDLGCTVRVATRANVAIKLLNVNSNSHGVFLFVLIFSVLCLLWADICSILHLFIKMLIIFFSPAL